MIDLHPNEKIILTERRHWLVFLSEISALIVAFFLPIIFIIFSDLFYEKLGTYLTLEETTATLLFISFAWFLILSMIFFVIFTDYYLDILIVTNQRIIDIDQIGLFSRDIATAPLENIEDIKIQIFGMVATALNYGDLHLQTAGSDKEILIRGIKNPEYVKKLIMSTYKTETTPSVSNK